MTATVQTSWLQGTSGAIPGATATGTMTTAGRSMAFAGVDMMRVGIALMFCLALGVVAILILRRNQRIPGSSLRQAGMRRIVVAESARLGPRATLHLVEYDRRVVLLSVGAGGVTLVDAQDRPDRAGEA